MLEAYSLARDTTVRRFLEWGGMIDIVAETTRPSIGLWPVLMDEIPVCRGTLRGQSGTRPKSTMRNQRAIFFGQRTTSP